MAGGASPQDDEDGAAAISDINVTPLVDIMLVLLIIFMVTAKLTSAKPVPVNSPKAWTGDPVASTVVLTIDKQGVYYLNGMPAKKQDIDGYLKQAVTANPEIQAVISADVDVPHGTVMSLIDTVRLANVINFALTVEQPAGAQPK